MANKQILIAEAIYNWQEKNAVRKSLDDGWLGPGKKTEQFQRLMAQYIGVKHAIFVNSGSSALLLALKALDLPKGSEVITCAAGFPSTLNPIIHCGLTPVLVDCEADTLNIDPAEVKKAITKKTKAIVVAHACGNPADLDTLLSFGLPLIEDNCDAIGAKWGKKRTGSFGTFSALSFYASHHITAAGGGGMLLTNDDDLATKCFSLRDWGKKYVTPNYYQTNSSFFNTEVDGVPYDINYSYDTIGFNFKMNEMSAAFAVEQFRRLPHFVESRNNNFAYLDKHLDKKYFLPIKVHKKATPSWFFYPIVLNNAQYRREELVNYLEKRRIRTRLFFAGNITRQPALKNVPYRVVGDLKNANILMEKALMIAVHPALSKKDLDYMIKIINKFQ